MPKKANDIPEGQTVDPTITKISATTNNEGMVVVMGLGTDNKVYFWSPTAAKWILEVSN